MRSALILVVALAACHPAPPEAKGDPDYVLPLPLREPDIMEGGTAEARGMGVIDGESFALMGEVIRISNIDAPQMSPHARCWAEARLAREATKELQRIREETLVPSGYRMTPQGKDDLGRTLGRVSYDGGRHDVGDLMIERGFAVPWTGKRWDWCGPVSDDRAGVYVLSAYPGEVQEAADEDAATPSVGAK